MVSGRTIGIAGAGSIGCFVGGMLVAGGRRIALLARPRVIDDINQHGLRATSLEGIEHRLSSAEVKLAAARVNESSSATATRYLSWRTSISAAYQSQKNYILDI